jgi:fructose-bisphosphate aldolase class II
MVSYKDIGLVNTKELFEKAYAGGYAIPAFNFVCMEQLLAIVDACIEKDSSFILQASAHICEYLGIEYVRHLAQAAAERIAKSSSGIKMALNLDHGLSFEDCVTCVENGFSSVMIDGSAESFYKNVEITKKVVDFAHQYDVCVEGELGVLSGTEGSISHKESLFTDPNAVSEFVKLTGVDSLAISIGTCHGLVKIKPNPDGTLPELRFDILAEIENRIPGFPIVLHGSSCIYPEYVDMINLYGGHLEYVQGIPEDQVRRAAKSAICKINVASDGWIAATAASRKALAENPGAIDPRVFLKAARNEMKNLYMRKIVSVMGSSGRK